LRPTFTWRYKARTRTFDAANYVFEARADRAREPARAAKELTASRAQEL
jgi:hypothetical protein